MNAKKTDKEKEVLSVLVSIDLKKRLKIIAKEERRGFSDMIRMTLEDKVASAEKNLA